VKKLILIAALAALPLPSAFGAPKGAEEFDNPSAAVQASEQAALERPAVRKRFQGYVKEGKLFKQLCAAIADDGRDALFSRVLSADFAFDENCLACKPLFKVFARACTFRKPKERPNKTKIGKAEPEPEPEPEHEASEEPSPAASPKPSLPFKEREPNGAVLNAATLLSQRLMESERDRENHLQGIEKLIEVLRDPAGKTKAELEYIDIFIEYLYAPFADFAVAQRKKEKKQQTPADDKWHGGTDEKKSGPSADDLFKF
jgi:hypothetical protein